MAKIKEELIVVKLSKLVKDSTEDGESITTHDLIGNLEAVVQELVSDGIVVEIIKG